MDDPSNPTMNFGIVLGADLLFEDASVCTLSPKVATSNSLDLISPKFLRRDSVDRFHCPGWPRSPCPLPIELAGGVPNAARESRETVHGHRLARVTATDSPVPPPRPPRFAHFLYIQIFGGPGRSVFVWRRRPAAPASCVTSCRAVVPFLRPAGRSTTWDTLEHSGLLALRGRIHRERGGNKEGDDGPRGPT
ncbi:hypothetical protein THAOC_06773, partial [Thalassiosira oceanica]